jgi:hypothetical protein
MKTNRFKHLAQANIARLRYPLSDPRMADMSERIDEMNRLAEESPGFVWRFKEDGSPENDLSLLSEYMSPCRESLLFFNMSVWKGEEALRNYVFRSAHKEVMRGRELWTERLEEPTLVLWTVEPGERPTVRESVRRFRSLRERGPSMEAFGFSR